MKDGWEYKKLGDVCDFEGGSQPPKSEWINHPQEGFVRMLQIRDFTQSRNFEIEYVKITKKTRLCKADDILIGRYGASVGKILTGLAGAYNVAIIKSIPDEKVIAKSYIRRYFESSLFQSVLFKVCTSRAAQAGFSKDDICDTPIPVPSLSEQQSIVEFLDSAFEKIDAMKANAEKALNEAQALFQASLKEMLEPKEGWEEKTINDVALFRNGIAHEKDIEEGGNYIVINSKFVATEGTIRKYVDKQLAPLYTNEIVMVMSDVPKGKTLAKCYIIECDNKYSLNQRICAFKSKGLETKLLYYMLNRNPNLLKYDNGENQTNLRKNQILECPVAYPTQINEQQSIVDTLDSLKSKVDKLQENYDKISQECDALKQAILKQIFE